VIALEAGEAGVGDLAVQRPRGDAHAELPGSAAVADDISRELVHGEHDIGSAAFRHAHSHGVSDHRLAQQAERTGGEFLV
jgi:hypothetical protein